MREIGALADGRAVRAATLSDGDLQAEVWDFGATLRALRLGGEEALAGPPDVAGVEVDRGYFGRVIGRVANRIGGARFELDGEEHHLDANEGANTLHGGAIGWSHAVWRFEAVEPARCVLTHVSPDGDMGFPGEVRARVGFTLAEGALEIVWEARADRPTPVNVTQHLYFALGGDPRDHTLQVAGRAVVAVGADLVPTGALMPVEGTPFDLREPRPLRGVLAADHPQLALAGGIDHSWALDAHAPGSPQVRLGGSRLSLALETDQPAVQVYDAHGITGPPGAFAGVALEPQGFPDAPNRPTFPSVTLRPGEAYRRFARYRLAPA